MTPPYQVSICGLLLAQRTIHPTPDLTEHVDKVKRKKRLKASRDLGSSTTASSFDDMGHVTASSWSSHVTASSGDTKGESEADPSISLIDANIPLSRDSTVINNDPSVKKPPKNWIWSAYLSQAENSKMICRIVVKVWTKFIHTQ